MSARAILVGLVIGLVFGAAIASVVWAITGSASGNDDVAAVCGVVERTPLPDENTSTEDLRRWAVADVMPSVAKADPQYRPLAEALEKALRAMQTFDKDELRSAVDRAKELCADA